MLQDSNNQRLMIGLFEFHKKGVATYTEAKNSHDVFAALHLMVLLQLEDVLVCDHLTHIYDSQMKFLKCQVDLLLIVNQPTTTHLGELTRSLLCL
jgi:hypothetical protein